MSIVIGQCRAANKTSLDIGMVSNKLCKAELVNIDAKPKRMTVG